MQTQRAVRRALTGRPSLIAAGLLMLTLVQELNRYFRAVIGRNDLWSDAANVWLPLAHHVSEGGALYVGAATDNKPPLFLLLNQLVFETGHYALAFYVLVGLANAATAWLLYRWVTTFARRETAAIAGLLFVAALPAMNGTIINVRSFALVFVLAALNSRRAVVQGACIAVAGLFSQYAVFGIPILLWYRHATGDLNARSFVRFCGAGLAIVVVSFAPLLWWGMDSLAGGVEWSFFRLSHHVGQNDVLNPWLSPMDWAGKLMQVGTSVLYLLVPATLYAVRVVLGWGDRRVAIEIAIVGFAAIYALPFAVKSLRYYWLFVLPFLAALAALEVESVYQRTAISGRE